MRKTLVTIISVMLFVMASCQKAQQPDTAILSERTIKIIDYFLDETENWYTDENQIIVSNWLSDDLNGSVLCIYANDSSSHKSYGKCNGIVHYRGYEIVLYDDSWNDYFWSSDTLYDVPDKNSEEMKYTFYDPIKWVVCISLTDTTINEQHTEFPYMYSAHTASIIDSVEKIIRQ